MKFSNVQDAIDEALWLNFLSRKDKKEYGVAQLKENYFTSSREEEKKRGISFLDVLPNDYIDMSKEHLAVIWDHTQEQAFQFSEILTMLVEVDTDVLQFILDLKIPFNR